jgi:ABC-type branched-subunit amino acid transport system substrate-binding protein
VHQIWQRKVLAIGTCMIAGALLIASCSSSSHSSSSASSSSPSSSSASSSSASNPATTAAAGPPSGTPVGIATINPDTGAGNLKPVGDGLAAFIAYANTTQGFGGRPGVQRRCDYANDPGKAADCARTEVADTSVLVAAGGEGRYSDVVVSTEAGATDPLPNVCAGLNTPGEGKATNTICLAAGSDIYNYLDMSYFKKHNPAFVKGYCITADSAAGHNTCGTAAGYATGLGMTLTQAFFSPTTADFLPVAQAALGAKADFILLGAAPVQELALVKALITLGSTTPIGTYSILLPQSSLPQIAAANFPIAVDAQFPDEATSTDPEIVLFRNWMQKQGFGAEIGDLSLSGWIAGRVVQAAVAATNTVAAPTTRAKILTFLRTAPITGIPLEPDPLSLQLAPKQTPGLTSVANPSAHVALIQHGQKTITNETVAIP